MVAPNNGKKGSRLRFDKIDKHLTESVFHHQVSSCQIGSPAINRFLVGLEHLAALPHSTFPDLSMSMLDSTCL